MYQGQAKYSSTPFTTGYSRFVECQGHSAMASKHSATVLPSVTLGKQHTTSFCRQTAICRVFFVGHSVSLCRVSESTRQRFTLGKMKMRKNPKIIAIFFSRKATTGQRAPASIEVAAFFAQNPQLSQPAGFKLTTSP